jgi:hypothetical protein
VEDLGGNLALGIGLGRCGSWHQYRCLMAGLRRGSGRGREARRLLRRDSEAR